MSEEEPTARELIEALRGGVPAMCDFCGKITPPEKLDPEEAGEWVCWECSKRWEEEAKKQRTQGAMIEAIERLERQLTYNKALEQTSARVNYYDSDVRTILDELSNFRVQVAELMKENIKLKTDYLGKVSPVIDKLYDAHFPEEKISQLHLEGFEGGVKYLKKLASEYGHTVTLGKFWVKEAFYDWQKSKSGSKQRE